MRPEDYAELGYAPLPGGFYNPDAISSADKKFELKSAEVVTARTTAAKQQFELRHFDDDELRVRQFIVAARRINASIDAILNELIPACMADDDSRRVANEAPRDTAAARGFFAKRFKPNAHLQHCLYRLGVELEVAHQHNAEAEVSLTRISRDRDFASLRTRAERGSEYMVGLPKFRAKFDALRQLVERAMPPEEAAEYFGAYFKPMGCDAEMKPDAYTSSVQLEFGQLRAYAQHIINTHAAMTITPFDMPEKTPALSGR